jgi:hypothetical protein
MIKSIDDLYLFDNSPANVRRMKQKVENYLQWLELTGLPNEDDTWDEFNEMEANSE